MSKKRVELRTLTTEEVNEISRLAKSRKESLRIVQRARLIKAMHDDANLLARDAGFMVGFASSASGPFWVKRFNAEGIAGLEDRPRSGKPVTHTEEVRSQLIDLALQKPRSQNQPFELWTLTRLQTEYEERYGLRLGISTIWKWLQSEGLEWKRQQSWFQDADKHDPEFVEKRGLSSGPM